MARLEVLSFRHGPFWNFSYVVGCTETGSAAVIDPAWDVPRLMEAAANRRWKITTALITHGHSDHVNGLAEMLGATGAPIVGHPHELAQAPIATAGQVAAIGGETVVLGAHVVEVLHTPGHSEGSLSFLADGRLFCGDTLNVGSVGRPGPDRQSVEALWKSVKRLRELPAGTQIHPGHDDGPRQSSSIGEEFATVEALRATTFEEFVTELERTTGRSHRHGPDSSI